MIRRLRSRLTPTKALPLGLRALDPDTARAVVVSFYMDNIAPEVIAAQRAVLERLVPPDVEILQVKTTLLHGDAMTRLMRKTRYPLVVFLDIDCIPLGPGAVDRLIARGQVSGLAGAAQRANWLKGVPHIYAGPFCLALTAKSYRELGQPSFLETLRGDVGEELTRVAESQGKLVDLLWPTACDEPRWDLTDTIRFGFGTTYDDDFWHAFEIRNPAGKDRFLTKCAEVLASLNDTA
jgi:hypothetical protein